MDNSQNSQRKWTEMKNTQVGYSKEMQAKTRYPFKP